MSFSDFGGYSRRAKIGDGIGAEFSSAGKTLYWIGYGLLAIFAILGFTAFILHLTQRSQYARTISGVNPIAGEVSLIGGDFISIVPNPVTSQIFVHGTGVGTINGMTPPLNGAITIAGGTAIGIVNTPATGTVTVNNEGATSLIAGTGITVSSATGDITVHDTLDLESTLPSDDVTSPHMVYVHMFAPAQPENVWSVGFGGIFLPFFIPGIVPGDGGQGNGVIGWSVPAVGQYQVSAECAFFISATEATDYNSIWMAINLGATTSDPTISGYIPPGGFTQTDASTPFPTGVLTIYGSISASFHAGCTGCAVPLGALLTIHGQLIRAGPGAAKTFSAACRVSVSRQK